jgi:predicted nucleic acid-binding protein
VLQGLRTDKASEIFQERFLALPCLSDPLPLALFVEAAGIYREGCRRGRTIRSSVDCLIAAIAIENGVPIWHRDRDFDAIAQYTPLQITPGFPARIR